MTAACPPCQQQGGDAEQRPLQRQQVDQRDDAPLRQHGEGQQQQKRRERVLELQIPWQRVHLKPPATAARAAPTRQTKRRSPETPVRETPAALPIPSRSAPTPGPRPAASRRATVPTRPARAVRGWSQCPTE